MRILHVLDHSVPHNTDYAVRALSTVRAMAARGYDIVQVTGPNHADSQDREELIEGFKYYRTPPVFSALRGVALLGEFEFIGEIAHRVDQIAHRTHPHLLHVHSPVLNALAVLRVGRRLGVPVIFDIHGLWRDADARAAACSRSRIRNRLFKLMGTFAARHAAHVVTAGAGARGELVARGVPASQISVVPNGVELGSKPVDAAWLKSQRNALRLGDSRVVAFIGRSLRSEGLITLVDAFPAVIAALGNVQLLIIGGGPDEALVRERIRVLALGAHVQTVDSGGQGPEAHWYELADVVVCPRLSSPLAERETSLRACTALSAGAAVILSDVGGHKEVLARGDEAALFRSGDPQDLAATIVAVLTDESRRRALQKAARSLAEARLDWQKITGTYAELYARFEAQVTQPA